MIEEGGLYAPPLVKHVLTDRCVMKMTWTTSKAPVGITPSFWEYVSSPLGSDSCTHSFTHEHKHTRTHTEAYTVNRKQTDKLTNAHQSLPFAIFWPAILLFLTRSLLPSHTNTQPLRWGNWMWQQILRGLLAGYQVNLWNGTHLTPAGWLWHLQQTWLNHSSKDWRLKTVASSRSAEVFSLFLNQTRKECSNKINVFTFYQRWPKGFMAQCNEFSNC